MVLLAFCCQNQAGRMKSRQVLLAVFALTFFVAAYFAQLYSGFLINNDILFIIRVLFSCAGTGFLFIIFFTERNQFKRWLKGYFILVTLLSALYLLKSSPSAIENFYMTIHRLITTPILAVIIVFANKFQQKYG